jgi:hypothetical protein
MKKLVFLGGTIGNNPWRAALVERLRRRGIDPAALFDPVVTDWNDEAQRREEAAKAAASIHLYYIGDPQQEALGLSAYSLVEATMALYDHPNRCVVVIDTGGMTGDAQQHAVKAMAQAIRVLKARFPTAPIFTTLAEAEDWLAEQLAPQR